MSVYVPTGSSASREEIYWKQQIRYITRNELKTNPKEMFRKDLLRQLRQWRSKGERMVLMMDANEDVIDGVICRQLRRADVGMREAFHKVTKEKKTQYLLQGVGGHQRHMDNHRNRSNECRLFTI